MNDADDLETLAADEAASRLAEAGVLRSVRIENGPIELPRGDGPWRFERVCAEGVDLSKSDLAGATFDGCRFLRCNLERTDFAECIFTDCRFSDSDAQEGSSLRHAQLDGAEFHRSDLSLCDLRSVRAWNLRLEHCTAVGIDLTGAEFSRHPSRKVTLTAFAAVSCDLSFALMPNLYLDGVEIRSCRLREALLDDADLSHADLRDTDLTGVQARRLALAGADLRGAAIEGLNPREIDLSGATIESWQQSALIEALGIRIED